jgi:hypothetical protein
MTCVISRVGVPAAKLPKETPPPPRGGVVCFGCTSLAEGGMGYTIIGAQPCAPAVVEPTN